jgi:hypothetical protein
MPDIWHTTLTVLCGPLDFLTVNAEGEHQFISRQIADRVGDRLVVRQFMALHIPMVVHALQPAPDFALGTLGRAGSVGFLCGYQPAEGLLLTLGQRYRCEQVLEHFGSDKAVVIDDF